jgi:hypothetical protein
MMKKSSLLLTVLIILLITGSFVVYLIVQEKRVYDRELFGMGEPIAFRNIFGENLNISRSFEELRRLGVRRLREWVWANFSLVNQTTVNPVFKEAMDEVTLEAQASNITIMGMSHDFPRWMTGIENDSQAVPIRNTTTGSNYMLFLEKYRTSWKTIAQTFQNITAWEIGNEFNSDAFLHPQGFNPVSKSPNFSTQEKADITTDLLYYGSLGISEGNPKATRVLGGLAPYPNIADTEAFLKGIYDNIWSCQWPSVNPDDYFQEVNWHPYLQDEEPTESNWVSPNKAIHDTMKEYGDEEKRVIFSEFGYSNKTVSQEDVQNYLLKAFQLAEDNFPWLETIYWFRLIDPTSDTTSEVNPPGFGLMNSDWIWKPAAYAYQSLTQKPRDSFNGCLLTFLGVIANDSNKTITETSDAFKTRTLQISEAGET